MPSPESRNVSTCLKLGVMLRQTLKEGIWGEARTHGTSQKSGPLSSPCFQVPPGTRVSLSEPQFPHVERKWTRLESSCFPALKTEPSTKVLFSLTDSRDKETTGSSW